MKIKLKILIVAFLMVTLFISNIYAVDMFLTSNTRNTENSNLIDSEDNTLVLENVERNEEISDNDIILSDYNDEESDDFLNNNETYDDLAVEQSPVVTTSSNSSSDTLSASDIINIILIAVCIVLIFLAVAILIRLK